MCANHLASVKVVCHLVPKATGQGVRRLTGSIRRLLGAFFVTMIALSGCSASLPSLDVASASKVETYRLSAGDRVRITVYNEPALSSEFAVSGEGIISYPLIGNLSVSDKSVQEAQELIRARLANGYVQDPRVTIEVINYRPYYILGEIAKPGQYPFASGLTVSQAVAVAGGFSYRANQRTVFIRRGGNDIERKVDISKNIIYVKPGDTIRIGERYF